MDKLDPRMDERLDKIDKIMTRQIRNIAIGVAAVAVAKNLSQGLAWTIGDVSRRVLDLKFPIKWY